MIYPKNFETKIGFDTIRKVIEAKCISSLGVEQCNNMSFSSDYEFIVRNLKQTNELLYILNNGIEFPLTDVFDVTSELVAIRAAGSYLQEDDLDKLRRSLNTIKNIARFFAPKEDEDSEYKFPELRLLCSEMQSFDSIINEIDSIIDKFGNIKDNASPELASIKRNIQSTSSGLASALRRIIAQGKSSGILDSDVSPSVRDGRLVIPVAPMNKRKIKGIVHDESATGKTIFIEPAEIVEANNTIRELEGEMRREIIRILTGVSNLIRPYIDEMLCSYQILGRIDFICAKAKFAKDIDASMPKMESEPQLEWYHAFHPGLFLSLREHGKEIVPLNIKLDKNSRILLISGPNAGGKSVCLKTVGIVQYMTQCGILPPLYSNSHMGIFSNLFIDIGDEQSIENDLSTYSSHLTNMKFFLNKCNSSSIILIDEFGGGTEPQIGGAIAQAMLHRFNNKKSFGVITTHYQNLKHFAEETEGIINGAMLYDRQKMEPLFQLSVGYPGSSFAVEIARKIGLPIDVITEAEEIVGSDYVNMDKYLLDIARDRKYWEKKRSEIHIKEKKIDSIIEKYNEQAENINKERREIIREAKTLAKNILAQSNAAIERTIHEIKTVQAEKEKTKEVRRQLDEFKNRLQNIDGGDDKRVKTISSNKKNKKKPHTEVAPKNVVLNVDDNVVMEGSTTIGQIISIDGKKAIVAFGNLKTTVNLSKLKKSQASASNTQAEKSFVSKTTTDEMRKKQLNFKQEIDVRGMRADEAIQAVTYFIDDAAQFNAHQVRILHGTGTGILRQRIREYLNAIPFVKSYRDEHVQFGGAGITVVEME